MRGAWRTCIDELLDFMSAQTRPSPTTPPGTPSQVFPPSILPPHIFNLSLVVDLWKLSTAVLPRVTA